MPFALDSSSNASFLSSIYHQAYPAKPEGLGISDSVFKASLNPITPLAVSLIYLIATRLANNRFKSNNASFPRDVIKGNPAAEKAVLAHNALLCLYSAWTAFSVFKILVFYFGNGVREGGLQGE